MDPNLLGDTTTLRKLNPILYITMCHPDAVTVNLYLEEITKGNRYYDGNIDFYIPSPFLVDIDTWMIKKNYKGLSNLN